MSIKPSALIAKFQGALDDKTGYIYGIKHEMWSASKQATYVNAYGNDPDRKKSCEYGGKWAGHWVTDCSGLFSWAFQQLGGEMFHGSNTMYKKWCTDKGKLNNGKRTDGKELKPGTAIFTGTEETHNHVGLYIGDGWVIEAQGAQNGVVKTKITNSKWTFWGELKGVDYTASDNDGFPADTGWHPTLRRGDKGEDVKLMQTLLARAGYSLGPCGVDGDFGRDTEKAVRLFQSDHKLSVDGVCGPMTWDALQNSTAVKQKTYMVTIRHLDKTQADALKRSYPNCAVTEE